MASESDQGAESSARGEAAWKQVREDIAERNRRVQSAGREERAAYERRRDDSRRASEARVHAQLLGDRRTP
jgi:hypothetical protein